MCIEINKEETIEFIKKYGDCLHYSTYLDNGIGPDFSNLGSINSDRIIDQLENLNQVSAFLIPSFSENDVLAYFRILYTKEFSNKRVHDSEIFLLNKSKKNIIDRKLKIRSIIT